MTVITAAATLDARLDTVQRSSGLSPSIVAEFGAFIDSAPDLALFRMNPLRYATEHDISVAQAIELFLQAAHAGILELNFGVLCPACGAFLSTPEGLRSLDRERPCGLCQCSVRASLDDNVEVAFTVTPLVRPIRYHDLDALQTFEEQMGVFFSPSRHIPDDVREHVKANYIGAYPVAPGQTLEVAVDLAAGHYLCIIPARHLTMDVRVQAGDANRAHMELMRGHFLPQDLALGTGPSTILMHNGTNDPATIFLLRRFFSLSPDSGLPAPPPLELVPFLTGKQLVTSQSFRELFRAESLPGAGGLQFKSLTFLFTDLKGSTEMYDRVGDFRAYGLVREHFGLLRSLVMEERGAIVKTIGDAIMATFAEPASALRAALRMHDAMKQIGEGDDLLLKIGLHAGPCIAVESNDRLDYFGQTVNIAARVQGLAREREICCTAPVYTSSEAQAILAAAGLQVEQEQANLRGVGDAVTVYRLF